MPTPCAADGPTPLLTFQPCSLMLSSDSCIWQISLVRYACQCIRPHLIGTRLLDNRRWNHDKQMVSHVIMQIASKFETQVGDSTARQTLRIKVSSLAQSGDLVCTLYRPGMHVVTNPMCSQRQLKKPTTKVSKRCYKYSLLEFLECQMTGSKQSDTPGLSMNDMIQYHKISLFGCVWQRLLER